MAVRIDNLKVPPQYILNFKNPKPLILDCEYNLPADEKGFVLKWYFNDQLIYQWISMKEPRFYVHSLMRNRIDLNYNTTDNTEYKHRTRHRALVITKPTINMTGVYTCAVGTFKSEEKRSGYMQVIVPESQFILKIQEANDGTKDINVECSAQDVYPEPRLTISIGKRNATPAEFIAETERDELYGLWDAIIYGKIKQDDVVIIPSDVHCILDIPNTTYTKQKEVCQFTSRSTTLSAQFKISTAITLLLSVLIIFMSNRSMFCILIS